MPFNFNAPVPLNRTIGTEEAIGTKQQFYYVKVYTKLLEELGIDNSTLFLTSDQEKQILLTAIKNSVLNFKDLSSNSLLKTAFEKALVELMIPILKENLSNDPEFKELIVEVAKPIIRAAVTNAVVKKLIED